MPTSRLKPRFPRVKPSDYLDHPDCPDQYADMPLVHVHAGHRFVDKGGRKRPRRADAQSSHTASATSGVNTTTNQRVPVASSSVSTSVFVNDLDFAQGDFDDGQSTGPWEHQDYEYEDQGGMDSSDHFRYSPDPDPDLDPDLQRPTHQELAEAVLPPPRASDPPLPPKRDGYLKFIAAEAKLRESQRTSMIVQYLAFRTRTQGRLRPLVSEDDKDDSAAPSPCNCQHEHAITREVVLYDVTAFYPLAVTFCASEPPCVADVERLAQLGFIASTAARPESAFSFRLIEFAEACWKVSPHAVTGYADGLELYFMRCGWGTKHNHRHPYDKELRKQLQRAIDEFRAVQTLESDTGDVMLGTVEALANKCPACFGPKRLNRSHHELQLDYMIALDGNFQQTREDNSIYDVQGIVPSLFLTDEAVLRMKENVDKTSKPNKMACTESWKAADGGSEKLSKRKIDTGLVAGVCRHDIALAMVNLEGSGEKLYFALAIVNQISKHVPTETRIGVLYDIACNFKHHIETRQLVPELFERLEFATSVFHAYAHSWGCQVEFNPRLIPNFGLTDGEGCERLWSALRSLIPINRQSNKSHRLVNLAVRTQAVNEANVARLGSWLTRRFRSAEVRRHAAQAELSSATSEDANLSEEAFRAAWQEVRTAEASKTAAQGAEEDRLKANKLYQLVEEYYRIERRIDEEDSDLDLLEGLKDKQGRLARDIDLAAFIEVQSGPGLSPKDLRHLCQCSVALRKLHREVIAYKTSREKLLSTRRGRGGSTLGQRGASKARKVELKTLSGVEKARKAYNKAVNAFQTAGGSSPSHLLSNFPIASSGHSVIELEETDSFWHDGFFTHAEAAWATDVLVKRGIVAVRNLDRADEEFARLGAEVRQALAWVEDEQDLISHRQALWSSALESAPTIYDEDEQHRLRTAIGGSDYATVRDCALIILAARMENLRKLERAWFRDSSFLVLWNETRGPAGEHEPMPAALATFAARLLRDASNTSRTASVTWGGAGEAASVPSTSLTDTSPISQVPNPLSRIHENDRQLMHRITEQLDGDMSVPGANNLRDLTLQLVEQEKRMLYVSYSFSDEGHGDDSSSEADNDMSDSGSEDN